MRMTDGTTLLAACCPLTVLQGVAAAVIGMGRLMQPLQIISVSMTLACIGRRMEWVLEVMEGLVA